MDPKQSPVLEELLKFLQSKFPHVLEKFQGGSDNPGLASESSSPASDMECTESESTGSSSEAETSDTDGYETVVSKAAKRKAAKTSPPASPPRKRAPPSASPPPVARATTSAVTPASPPTAASLSASTESPEKRPPPLFLRDKSKWDSVSLAMTERKLNFSNARSTAVGIKIQASTPADHRGLTKLLRERGHEYHTYALADERRLSVVIRGLPVEIPVDSIKSDLESKNIPVVEVHRMYKATTKRPYEMVLVHLELSPEGKQIFNVKTICNLSGLQVELPRNRGMPGQCHRCQLYGHAARFCNARPRCVKCLGDHATRDCSRKQPTEEPPSCVLCGQQGHPANYRGCPKAPRSVNPRNRPSRQPQAAVHLRVPPREAFVPAPAPALNAWSARPSAAPPAAPAARLPAPAARPPAPAVRSPAPSARLTAPPAPLAPLGLAADMKLVCNFAATFDPSELTVLASKLRATDGNPQARMMATCQHVGLLNAICSFRANGV